MRNSLKDLERRLAKLEQRRKQRAPYERRLVWSIRLSPAEKAGLKPGQRIVQDHYEGAEGNTVRTSERISDDPSDIGLCYTARDWNSKAFERKDRGRHGQAGVIWTPFRRPLVNPKGGSPRPFLVPREHTPSVPLLENGPGEEVSPDEDASATGEFGPSWMEK